MQYVSFFISLFTFAVLGILGVKYTEKSSEVYSDLSVKYTLLKQDFKNLKKGYKKTLHNIEEYSRLDNLSREIECEKYARIVFPNSKPEYFLYLDNKFYHNGYYSRKEHVSYRYAYASEGCWVGGTKYSVEHLEARAKDKIFEGCGSKNCKIK